MIDLEPGYQKLNGDDALDYVRYRHTDSDFARIVRQQTFLSSSKRRTRASSPRVPGSCGSSPRTPRPASTTPGSC